MADQQSEQDLRKYVAEIQAQLQEAQRRAEQEKERADQEKQRADREKRRADEEQQRREELQTQVEPSTFYHQLRLAEDELFSRLVIENNSQKRSSETQTDVSGKLYPSELRKWVDFPEIHNAMFRKLEDTFGNQALFASIHEVQYQAKNISPEGIKNELDLRQFIRTAIELPAVHILRAYFTITSDPKIRRVTFRNNASGLLPAPLPQPENPDGERPAKRRSPTRQEALPDRWGVIVDHDSDEHNYFVGECKAAHKLKANTVRKVLARHPGDDFFIQVLKRKAAKLETSTAAGEDDAAVPGEVSVAQVLCQTFHYMIASGLEFGYVASGEALIFLRVPDDEPQVLYYFVTLFPTRASARSPAATPSTESGVGGDEPPGQRPIQNTALSYLCTFCLTAVASEPRTPEWIQNAKTSLTSWPLLPKELTPKLVLNPGSEFTLRPGRRRDDDDDNNGNGGASGRRRSPMKRGYVPSNLSVSSTATAAQSDNRHGRSRQGSSTGTTQRRYRIKSPLLPYCTQACLLGLVSGAVVDPKCPNVALHPSLTRGDQTFHRLSAKAVCNGVKTQLGNDLDQDCEHQRGHTGATGALFKLTLTGSGYTFVAKGVQRAHKDMLFHEASIYNHLERQQGFLVPVLLGIIELTHVLHLTTMAEISHMMLLSWAGPAIDILQSGAEPDKFEQEMEDTIRELFRYGVEDWDIRPPNYTWNEERQRVMRIDLGQSKIVGPNEQGQDSGRSTHDEHRVTSKESDSPSVVLSPKKRAISRCDMENLDDNAAKRRRSSNSVALQEIRT